MSAYIYLHGSKINIGSNSKRLWFVSRDGLIQTESPSSGGTHIMSLDYHPGAVYTINCLGDDTFQIIDINGLVVLSQSNLIVSASAGAPLNSQFYFSYDLFSNTNTRINLRTIDWNVFNGQTVYLKSVANNNTIIFDGVARIPVDNQAASYVAGFNVNLNLKVGGQLLNTYFQNKNDAALGIKCCTNTFQEQEICKYLGLSGENPKCDVEVDAYCVSHLDDPLCSCYNTADAISKLPPAMQPYSMILEAQPKCWLKDCALKGYHNLRLRDAVNCDITICSQETNVSGSNNIVDVDGRVFCKGGMPMVVTPDNAPDSNPNNTPDNSSSDNVLTSYIQKNMWFILLLVIAIWLTLDYSTDQNIVSQSPAVGLSRTY